MPFSNDVYLEFGRAADLAQAFECELGTALLAEDAHKAGLYKLANADVANRLTDAIDKRTLGASLKVFGTRFSVSGDLEEMFNRALSIRNKLMHGFFFREFPKSGNVEGNADIVRTLKAYQADLEAARAKAAEISEAMIKALKDAEERAN